MSGADRESVNIVVLQADGRPFGLVVDGIHDTEEIVVKPLGRQLKGLSVYSGATILGDGSVALILDVVGVAQRGHVLVESLEKALSVASASESTSASGELQRLLVFRTADDGRMAVPLSRVARLEEFPATRVERVGAANVIQYRGELLPLVHVSQILAERRSRRRAASPEEPHAEVLHVIVHATEGRSVGLVVDRILDIVEERVEIQRVAARHGVEGTAVIRGRTTEILDAAALAAAAQDFAAGHSAGSAA
jgi:two-component system chemotaxis sensor kinase CheA